MAILSSDLIRQGAAGASTGYTIDNSCRFNDDDSPFMSRTQDSGSQTTWTISCWVKIGNIPGNFTIWCAHTAYQSYAQIRSSTGLEFAVGNGSSSNSYHAIRRLFRDPSAWYHIVTVFDSTNAAGSERARIYINGERIINMSTTGSWAKDYSSNVGSTQTLYIGEQGVGGNHLEGYLAEFHQLDGYAYGPEYFGEFDENGIWIPKEYTGSYGTNGCYLEFQNSGSLGADTSGQGINFSTNGLEANDQVEDTPTNNKITFNPLNNQRSGGTITNGNLDYAGPGTRTMIGTTGGPFPTSGKWAIAIKAAQVSTTVGWSYGLQKAEDADMGDAAGSNEDIGAGTGGANMTPQSSDGYYYNYSTSTTTDPSLPITTSDEFWLAVDIDSGKYWFGIYDASASGYKWVAADAGLDGDPGAGTNETGSLTGLQNNTGNFEFIFSSKQTSQILYLQREADLAGAVPTGYTYWENVKDLI